MKLNYKNTKAASKFTQWGVNNFGSAMLERATLDVNEAAKKITAGKPLSSTAKAQLKMDKDFFNNEDDLFQWCVDLMNASEKEESLNKKIAPLNGPHIWNLFCNKYGKVFKDYVACL